MPFILVRIWATNNSSPHFSDLGHPFQLTPGVSHLCGELLGPIARCFLGIPFFTFLGIPLHCLPGDVVLWFLKCVPYPAPSPPYFFLSWELMHFFPHSLSLLIISSQRNWSILLRKLFIKVSIFFKVSAPQSNTDFTFALNLFLYLPF
ncbi:hypothetical protein BsWGS_06125 [Bradybaena similaris]